MRYVVTGGSGFVGAHLVKSLIDKGEDFFVIDKISNHINLDNINSNKNIKKFEPFL